MTRMLQVNPHTCYTFKTVSIEKGRYMYIAPSIYLYRYYMPGISVVFFGSLEHADDTSQSLQPLPEEEVFVEDESTGEITAIVMTEFCIKLLVLTFKVTKEILIVQCVIEHSSVTRRYPVRLKMLLCFISFAGSPSEVHAEDQLQVSSNTVDQDRFGFFDHSKKKDIWKNMFF